MSDAAHVPTRYISTCLGFRVYTTFFMSAAAHVATDDISTCLGFNVYTTFFMFHAAGLHYVSQAVSISLAGANINGASLTWWERERERVGLAPLACP